MSKQAGNGHEWRDLSDKEVIFHNPELREKAAKSGEEGSQWMSRKSLPSWYKTRECTRCGLLSPDYLDPENSSCNIVVVRGIHES
jgi:hypothetical protein